MSESEEAAPAARVEPSARVLTVAEAETRLDAFLVRELRISRRAARALLEQGAVSRDGRRLSERDKGSPLLHGTQLAIAVCALPETVAPLPAPERALQILAQGPGWIAVDKPAGVPVHPRFAEERGTMLNAVVARYPGIVGVGEGGLRSGVVHRLDTTTSGVLLFATEDRSWHELREAFRTHRVDKRYRALVSGALRGQAREELPLVVARHHPARVRVARADERRAARLCRLRWRALETFASAALIEVELETGFLHQIRATFAHLGYPLLGDRHYAATIASPGSSAPRPMLHAAALAVGDVQAESPDPPDFRDLLQELRDGAV